MARLFQESFEAGHVLRFSSISDSGVGPIANSSLDGSYLCQLGAGRWVEKIFGTALSEAYIGNYHFTQDTAAQRVVSWRVSGTSTELGRVQLNGSTKKLEALVGGSVVATGATILNASTKYHIQVHIKIADAGGVLDVKLDDVPQITFAGDTKPGADTTFDAIRWGDQGNSYMDNMVVNDITGGADNTWPGIVRFKILQPNANGNYNLNWTRFNTGIPAWDNVDEIPHDSDTTYLYTTSAAVKESFGMADQSLTAVTYKSLITAAIVKKDSGTIKLKIGIRDLDNATDYQAAAVDVGVSYGVVEERRTVDPSTAAAWTSSGINATEALIESA